MKQLGWVLGAALIIACGGRAQGPDTGTSAGASGGEGGAGADAPGVGPIDTTGLAMEFPELLCAGSLASLHLVLPCKIGMRLPGSADGGSSVVECYDTSGRVALNFVINLTSAARSIGTSVRLPFNPSSGASPLFPLPPTSIEVDGVNYEGVLNGSLTFERVDPSGRGFVAFLTLAFISWTDPQGNMTDCDFDPMRLWATAGNFI